MDRAVFLTRLRAAADEAFAFAQTLVIEELPLELTFHVYFKDDPNVPDDGSFDDREGVSLEAGAEHLFREGSVPEWIDVNVSTEDGARTTIELRACRRFHADEDELMHHGEGKPPFHILGPALPPRCEGRPAWRFSLHWRMRATNPDALAEILRRRATLEHLVLSGPRFDDASTREFFATLASEMSPIEEEGFSRAIVLSGTRITGYALRSMTPSKVWFLDVPEIPLDLSFVEDCLTLTALRIEGEPTELRHLSLVAGAKNLRYLGIRARVLRDLSWLQALPRLSDITMEGSSIDDDALAHVARIWAGRDEKSELTLMVRDTRVRQEGLAAFRARVPWARIIADDSAPKYC